MCDLQTCAQMCLSVKSTKKKLHIEARTAVTRQREGSGAGSGEEEVGEGGRLDCADGADSGGDGGARR